MAFTTKKTLLSKISDGDDNISWDDFFEMYRPLIFIRGRDFGFSKTECDDLIQLVMAEIFKMRTTFTYNPAKGRFRDYMKKIIFHQALRLKKEIYKGKMYVELSEDLMEENDKLEQSWQEEWEAQQMKMALDELKHKIEPVTYQAFDLYALQNCPAEEVAAWLKISVNSVYLAKTRSIAKLKEIISNLPA